MLRFADDVSAARWIAARLHPFCQDTGSVIPEGFDAYVRIFHPAYGERWSDIAARNGRTVHPEMQLHAIQRAPGAPIEDTQGDGYDCGSMPIELANALIPLVGPATTTPDRCWFAVWDGWGGMDDQGVAARLEHPGRTYLVAPGPVEDAATTVDDQRLHFQSASIWWPEDLAWCVATEVDYAWTYVGGGPDLIQSILRSPDLEALEVELHHLPFWNSDRLNSGE